MFDGIKYNFVIRISNGFLISYPLLKYHIHTDHSGSIVDVRDTSGNIIYRVNYDAWGRERNPVSWDNTPNPYTRPVWLIRGYTGHEHLPEFGLINMNGRLYDPVLCRMLSPDNFVQDATGTQGFNRYSYVLNNPLKYKDPSGENPLLIAAGVYFLFFTESGFSIQKYVSPVAVKISFAMGTEMAGIGIKASLGVPQVFPVSARVHGGIGYYVSHDSPLPDGWYKTYGYEVGITPFVRTGTTYYDSPGNKFDQQLWNLEVGVPGIVNIKYENDYSFGDKNKILNLLADQGDRYRTAAGRIEIGPFAVGFNLFTGDPGLKGVDRQKYFDNSIGKDVYIKNEKGDNPDEYRMGIGYFEFMGVRIGENSERVRHNIQNKLAHDKLKPGTPWFRVMNNDRDFYFQLGSGIGYLW